jgi:hypothetical protein
MQDVLLRELGILQVIALSTGQRRGLLGGREEKEKRENKSLNPTGESKMVGIVRKLLGRVR